MQKGFQQSVEQRVVVSGLVVMSLLSPLPAPFVHFGLVEVQFFGDALDVPFVPDIFFPQLQVFFLKQVRFGRVHPLSGDLADQASGRVTHWHLKKLCQLGIDVCEGSDSFLFTFDESSYVNVLVCKYRHILNFFIAQLYFAIIISDFAQFP